MGSYDSMTSIANRHDFDNTFTNAYNSSQTAATVITPTTGKLLKIAGVYISAVGASADNYIRLYFSTTNDTVVVFYPNAESGAASSIYVPLVVWGQINEPLKITSNLGLDKNYFISVNYKEE